MIKQKLLFLVLAKVGKKKMIENHLARQIRDSELGCPYYNCPHFGDCERYPDECDRIKKAKDLANELEYERAKDLKLEKIKEEK